MAEKDKIKSYSFSVIRKLFGIPQTETEEPFLHSNKEIIESEL